MINKTARTLGMTMLAGSMMLGMSACTQVSSKASKASDGVSKITDATNSGSASAPSGNQTSNTQAPSPTSDTGSSDPGTSDTGSSDTATDGGSGAPGGLTTGKVGQEVKTSEMTVKVAKITDPVKPTDDFSKPDAGKHFVGVNVTATNNGSKPLAFGETCLDVKLTDNTTAKEGFLTNYGSDLGFQNLQKGDTASGDVVYQVTDGQKIKSIDVDCDQFDDSPGVRITAN